MKRITEPLAWLDHAACRGLDPALFFPERGENYNHAKQVCAGCPVRAECLEHALAIREDDGIWGGLTGAERRRLRRQRRKQSRGAA